MIWGDFWWKNHFFGNIPKLIFVLNVINLECKTFFKGHIFIFLFSMIYSKLFMKKSHWHFAVFALFFHFDQNRLKRVKEHIFKNKSHLLYALIYRTITRLESHGFVTVVTDFHNISRENYVTTCDKVWHLKNKKIGFSVTFCDTLWHLKYFNFAFPIENKLKFQIIELFSFWNWHTPRKQK